MTTTARKQVTVISLGFCPFCKKDFDRNSRIEPIQGIHFCGSCAEQIRDTGEKAIALVDTISNTIRNSIKDMF